MNTHPHPTPSGSPHSHLVLRVLTGPVRLLRAQFTRRNAVCLVALSVPALLVTALLTLPAFLFNTPQHNEFFEFAQQLDNGAEHWFAVGLSACCCLFAFAIPAQGGHGDGDPS